MRMTRNNYQYQFGENSSVGSVVARRFLTPMKYSFCRVTIRPTILLSNHSKRIAIMKSRPHSRRGDALKFLSSILIAAAVLMLFTGITHAAPIVYNNEALYLADLTALGYSAIHESFEDNTMWANSRNSISSPGSTPTVTSQGIVWTSNYLQNNIATGDVGGSAPDGVFAIYKLQPGYWLRVVRRRLHRRRDC